MSTFLEFHILQALPPSNVNRDGDGAPKSARYGGKRRARVSSQSWKRATRLDFPEQDRGVRTKRLAEDVAAQLAANHGHSPQDAEKEALKALASAGIGKGDNGTATGELKYLLLFGKDLPARIAAEIADGTLTEGKATELLHTADKPLSLALFGRMVADDNTLGVDGACQVAHAISTHEAASELDYYTAVDERRTEDAGAGMLGEIGFQSSVLYRHANINLDQLTANLNGSAADAVDGVGKFIESFTASMPSGYGNSFAPGTLPKLVAVVIREGKRPINLGDAFEAPVTADGGYLEPSAKRLITNYTSTTGWWPVTAAFAAHRFDGATATEIEEAFGPNHSLPELITAVKAALDG